MSIDIKLKKLSYATVGGLWHFYTPYSRVTLCGVDKVDRPTTNILVPPVCPECAATLIEEELEET